MKKLLALVLVLAMGLSLAGCGLFSDTSIVKFDEYYTHNDPEGLAYDQRTALMAEGFGNDLENMANAAAYPDSMKYDDAGNIIGMYSYDPETGLASGWTDLSTGEYVEEEVELGKPDTSLMIHIPGNVSLAAVVYGNQGKAVRACFYCFLSDPAAKELVLSQASNLLGLSFTAETDTVLSCVLEEADIDAEFDLLEALYGETYDDRSAAVYADNLKMTYGLKPYGVVNPYKPYDGRTDPQDISFDEKQILTSSGEYSFADEAIDKAVSARTDVIYGSEGVVVAHYTYLEFSAKEMLDKAMDDAGSNFYNPTRLNDTVVVDMLVGKDLDDLVSAYIGYTVLKDNSFDGYVTNVEETYFGMPYEE